MANPRPAGRMQPLKLLNVALLWSLKNRYFGAKSIRSLENVQNLALKMTIFFKMWPSSRFGLAMAELKYVKGFESENLKIFLNLKKI